jgi:hypothetical protein
MKFNKKALRLIEKGLSAKTVSKLDENQINVLHSKLISEQSVINVPKGDLPKINQLKSQKQTFQVYEKEEVDEQDDVSMDPNKETETQDPHQVGPSTDDGFDDYEVNEAKKYKGKANPWAICHAQVGPKKTRKFERCVQSVKKQLGEGKNPVSLFLENEIMKIVERNLPPRITKRDLVKYLTEAEPAVAPTKPTVKPGTPPREKPKHPGKNPNPGVKPAPKAKKVNEAEPAVAPTKPTVKPGTPPRERPKHPGKNPNPGVKPAPKAKLPSPEMAKDKIIDIIKQILEK